MSGKLKIFVSDDYINPHDFDEFVEMMAGFSQDTLNILCHPEEYCSPRDQVEWAHRIIKEANEGSDVQYVFTNSDFITKEINLQMLVYIRAKAGCELIDKRFAIDPSIVSSYTLSLEHNEIKCVPNEREGIGIYFYPTFNSVIEDMNELEERLIWGETDE